jgi:Rad3-related DNA helicase
MTEFRSDEQKNFSEIISQHINKLDGPLLLEGGTGLGKTLAYLYPLIAASAAEEGKRIAIVMPTHQLIEQLLQSADLKKTIGNVSIAAFLPKIHFDKNTSAFFKNKEEALAAKIMVCTMHSVIIDQRVNGKYNGVTKRDYILFDEGDQLPDMAGLASNLSISADELKEYKLDHLSKEAVVAQIIAMPEKEDFLELKAKARIIQQAILKPQWYRTGGFDNKQNLVLTHHIPGRLIKKVSNLPHVAFISSTLSVGGNFKDFTFAMGIDDEKISSLSKIIEPNSHADLQFFPNFFDFRKQDILWFENTIKQIESSKKPCLVITTSFDDAITFGAKLNTVGPVATIRSRDETTSDAVSRMSGDILIAAGAWAGLDTPKQWASIVIPKVPFGTPTIIDNYSLTTYFHSRNSAIRRLKQGIGRGMRHPDSKCDIYIMDVRAKLLGDFVPVRFRNKWKSAVSRQINNPNNIDIQKLYGNMRKAIMRHYNNTCSLCKGKNTKLNTGFTLQLNVPEPKNHSHLNHSHFDLLCHACC